jgi:glycosyltransferase involved in cell wall biosynthesis
MESATAISSRSTFTPADQSSGPAVANSGMKGPRLRIAVVSKTNGCVGGASFFAENLGKWMLEAGHEVVHFCVAPKPGMLRFQKEIPCKSLASRFGRHINWRARNLGMVEPFPWEYWSGLKELMGRFDLFHFHDLYMAISPRTLEFLANSKPVILTAHDCSIFTGGCLNHLGCRRFEMDCGRCPQSGELGHFDFTRSNLKKVRRMARSSNINYVFPSKWIHSEALRSLTFGAEAVHIPNGFSPRDYKFTSREEARKRLGLALDRKIVAVSSASMENKLKGMRNAVEAIVKNKDINPLAIFIGHPSSGLEKALEGVQFMLAGFVQDRERLGLFYSAADLLLYPSLGDNLPITIQEAMAAGTPVLAFDVGGVPELVRQGETGWLVPVGDQEALNLSLRRVLEVGDTAAVGSRAQKFVMEQFSPEQCVERYVEVYRAAISRNNQAKVNP